MRRSFLDAGQPELAERRNRKPVSMVIGGKICRHRLREKDTKR